MCFFISEYQGKFLYRFPVMCMCNVLMSMDHTDYVDKSATEIQYFNVITPKEIFEMHQ